MTLFSFCVVLQLFMYCNSPTKEEGINYYKIIILLFFKAPEVSSWFKVSVRNCQYNLNTEAVVFEFIARVLT